MAANDDEFDLFSWKTIMAIAVVIILVLSLFFGYDIISGTQRPFETSGDIAEDGDAIEVDYTGRFTDGTVFDTTYEDVADNDYLHPKAISFKEKGLYQPFSFILGNGANIQEVDMPGFEDAVRGMKANQSKSVIISAEDGFGLIDDEKFETVDLEEVIPLYTDNMNITQFRDAYSMTPQFGLTFVDSIRGWNASVYFVDSVNDVVTIKHEPFVGEIIDYYGVWTSEVIMVDSSANNGDGEIHIRHLFTDDDVGALRGTDPFGDFVLSVLDTAAGTFTLDYNHEGAGQQLVFEITLVSLKKET